MIFCLVIFLSVLSACTAEPSHRETSQRAEPVEPGFVSIFDGKTLHLWNLQVQLSHSSLNFASLADWLFSRWIPLLRG